MLNLSGKKRFLLLTFILFSIVIISLLVGSSANNDFSHQFNIPKGYCQPYQIGLPSTVTESVTPTIDVTINSNNNLIIWLLTEKGYNLLKEKGFFASNESVVKYEVKTSQSVDFQWTFSPGETKYLVLDAYSILNQDWIESVALGSVKITNIGALSTSLSSPNSTFGFTAIITIPVLLLTTLIILRTRRKDLE